MNRSLVRLCGAAVTAFACLSALAQNPAPAGPAAPEGPAAQKKPVRPDRVFAKDLEGLWIARDYVEALRTTRLPLAAARKARPHVVKVQKDSRGYPIVRTDFDHAILMRIVEIEPENAPGAFRIVTAADDAGPVSAADATYIRVRGKKNAQGRFETLSIADPVFSKKRFRDYVFAPEGLGTLVNGLTIAGNYVDDKQAPASFSAEGEATLAGERFPYEVVLSGPGGSCNMLEDARDADSERRKRVGFAWKGAKLELFAVSGKAPGGLRCAPKPFAVLTPQG